MRPHFLSPTLAALIACSVPAPLSAQTPPTPDAAPLPSLAYQGRLLEGSQPVQGARLFTFAILDSTGVELWNSGSQTLPVNTGLYSIVLGATGMPTLPLDLLVRSGLKLHVTVSGEALAPDVDILPALQARSAWDFVNPLVGDVTGTQNQTLVMKLQGSPLDLTTTPPTTGQALVFDGAKWAAGTVAGTQGPIGPVGPEGPAGPAGATGAQGIQPPGLTRHHRTNGCAGPEWARW